jgi:hypothetical protein
MPRRAHPHSPTVTPLPAPLPLVPSSGFHPAAAAPQRARPDLCHGAPRHWHRCDGSRAHPKAAGQVRGRAGRAGGRRRPGRRRRRQLPGVRRLVESRWRGLLEVQARLRSLLQTFGQPSSWHWALCPRAPLCCWHASALFLQTGPCLPPPPCARGYATKDAAMTFWPTSLGEGLISAYRCGGGGGWPLLPNPTLLPPLTALPTCPCSTPPPPRPALAPLPCPLLPPSRAQAHGPRQSVEARPAGAHRGGHRAGRGGSDD